MDMQKKVDTHMSVCVALNDIYAKKNADYGDSWTESINEWGLSAAGVRLSDKMNRLKRLLKDNDPQVTNESLEDCCLDLANYSIMLYMYLTTGEKEKENVTND